MRGFDIRSAVVIAFKYRLRAIIVFCGALLAAVAVCVVMTTQYSATTSLLVKIGRELIYRPDVGTTQAALPTMDKDTLIASNIAIMKGADIQREVIKTIGAKTLYPKIVDPPEDPQIIAWIKHRFADVQAALGMYPESIDSQVMTKFDRKLSVDTVKKTDIVAVSFMHPDPVIAARVANMVVDLFQKKTGTLYANPNLDFMQKTVDSQRAALTVAETRLNDYRRQYGVYDFDQQIGLLLKQKMDIDTGLKSADAHIAELNGMLAALLVQRNTTPQTIQIYSETERHKVIDDTQSQLLALTLQEQQLAGRFSDKYQPLIDVRNQIKVAQSSLNAARGDTGAHTRRGVNDTYQELNQETLRRQAELRSSVERRDAMKAQLGIIGTDINQLSTRQRELQDLQHDVELRTDEVKTSYDKLGEARVVEGLNREKPASFSVVQAAVPPELSDPARPLPLLYTAGAAVLGVIGAICVIFFSYRMAGTFVTPEQASRRLNMPVLAVISYNRAYQNKRAVRQSSGTSGLNAGQSIIHSGEVATRLVGRLKRSCKNRFGSPVACHRLSKKIIVRPNHLVLAVRPFVANRLQESDKPGLELMSQARPIMKSFGTALDSHKGFGPGFDFARIALAFSVLLWHSPYIVTGDNSFTMERYLWIWNDAILPMFFGLSGFLIAGSAQRLSLPNFLVNRGLRIIPALAVEITLSALVLGPVLTSFSLHQYFSTPTFFLYFANIFGFVHFHLPGLFLSVPHDNMVNASLWTVPYEFLCYGVMSCLIITGFVRRGPTLVLLAAATVVCSTVYQFGLVPVHGVAKQVLDTALLGQGSALLPSFLLGAAAYALRYGIPYDIRIAITCVAVTAVLAVVGDGTWWQIASLAFLTCPIFIYFVLFIGLTRIGKIPFFSRGDYSYGIYLYGFPIQQTLMVLFPDLKSIPVHMVSGAVLATLFATFSWHCIEKPILRVRKNFSFMARKDVIAAEGDRQTGTSPATLGSAGAIGAKEAV